MPFLLQFTYYRYSFEYNFKIMAKKKKIGRPEGVKKEPVNIYMSKDRAARLRSAAKEQQKTISIVVENALEKEGI